MSMHIYISMLRGIQTSTKYNKQSEMADLARRATRWVGTLKLKFHGNTFRWPTTLTFDLKFWKYLSVREYPYSMCMLSFMMIGWEMTEILHFEILRKHGQTHKHTNRHGHYNTSPSPMGGEVKMEPPSFDTDISQMRGGNLVLSNETPGMKLATRTSNYLIINIAKFRNFYERTNYEEKNVERIKHFYTL